MAQWAEQSLATLEDPSSNSDIRNLFAVSCIEKTRIKKEEDFRLA